MNNLQYVTLPTPHLNHRLAHVVLHAVTLLDMVQSTRVPRLFLGDSHQILLLPPNQSLYHVRRGIKRKHIGALFDANVVVNFYHTFALQGLYGGVTTRDHLSYLRQGVFRRALKIIVGYGGEFVRVFVDFSIRTGNTHAGRTHHAVE